MSPISVTKFCEKNVIKRNQFNSIVRGLIVSTVFLLFTVQTVLGQVGVPRSYENGMVVSADQIASDIGKDVLKQGGNAVDAAVATHFALSVTFPVAGNLGGGGFMVLHLNNGTQQTLDFRETAPSQTSQEDYLNSSGDPNGRTRKGPFSVGVPGSVHGMITALQKYGTMPLDLILEPAIDIARNGFRLNYQQARRLNLSRNKFSKYPSSDLFSSSEEDSFQEGDLFVQKDLAATLERIAQFGNAGFYRGITAELIVKQIQKLGGKMTLNDLESYESVWRDPIKTSFKGYDLLLMPPPSSGGIAIAQILNMINEYDPEDYGWNSADYIHLLTEAEKRAYADRAYFLGDPDYVAQPTPLLISEEYARDRFQSFDPRKATPVDSVSHGDVPFFEESMETTHFSVVDQKGNAVSVTTTLNSAYGSGIVVGEAGFLLNNEIDDFAVKPGVPNQFGLIGGKANAIQPGKRMVSSMSPTIVTQNGEIRMVLGSPGGSTIITTVLQVFLNVALFDMNIQQAVAAPRVHHQWRPEEIYFEPFALSKKEQFELYIRGHKLKERDSYVGHANCIYIHGNGLLDGGADPRGLNSVSGY